MSAREHPEWMYSVPGPWAVRVRELEAALLESNDGAAKLREELCEPSKAEVTIVGGVRGHVLFEFPLLAEQLDVIAARGTARLLMGHEFAARLATQLLYASGKAAAQRIAIERSGGNLPRTAEEDALLSGERP